MQPKNGTAFALLLLLTIGAYAQPNPSKGQVTVRDEYLSDANGTTSGLTVHVGTLPLTIRASNHRVSAGTLSISKAKDANGRDLTLLLPDGSPAASFSAARSGRIESLDLKNGMKLMLTPAGKGLYNETLSLGHGGRKIHERVVSTDTRLQPSDVSLDIIAKTMNLGGSWSTNVTIKRNTSGTLMTVTNAAGAVVLYVVRYGPDKAAFDASGNLLFVDLFADIYYRPASETEDWADIQPLVPDHIVISADGRVGAYVSAPAPSAIRAFWDDRDPAGNTIYMYRLGSETRSVAASTYTVSHPNRPRRQPVSAQTCTEQEETSQTCWTDSLGNSSCGETTTTYYWVCDSSSGGSSGGGSSGGGTSSGGTSSNQVTGDAILTAKVSQGLDNATTKLGNQQCQALLSGNYTDDGQTLLAVMKARSFTSASDYLNRGVIILNGVGSDTCNAGFVAWVNPPGITQIHVCNGYKNLTVGMAGVTLIHEMLHTLGLSENPPNTSAMTPEQINNMVANACGSN